MSKIRWLPLESNPDVLNEYARDIGVPASWQFVDVYSLDGDILATFPQPVIAVILLFPDASENVKKYDIGKASEKSVAYFMKQTISNACGTVAMIHCLANNTDKIKFVEGKPFSKFIESTKDMSPGERAQYLETDTAMGTAHGEHAQSGQTEAPPLEANVTNHFVAFVDVNGEVIELNGAKNAPIVHGKISRLTLLHDVVDVVRKYIERDPDEINFTVMALVPA